MNQTKALRFADRIKFLLTGNINDTGLTPPDLESIPDIDLRSLSGNDRPVEQESVKKGEINIVYYPDLVPGLKKEHRWLEKAHGNIVQCVKAGLEGEAGAFQKAGVRLSKFQRTFQGHVMKENVCLWTYLKKFKETYKDVQELHRSMVAIQSTVNKFCDKYRNDIDESNARKFLEIFAGLEGKSNMAEVSRANSIGGVLLTRIETEEGNPYLLYDQLGKANG